jgi:hypothetical protein
MIVNIDSLLEAKPMNETMSMSMSESQQLSTPGHYQPTIKHAKLPKLTLKQFDGQPCEWQAFWDSFTLQKIHFRFELF